MEGSKLDTLDSTHIGTIPQDRVPELHASSDAVDIQTDATTSKRKHELPVEGEEGDGKQEKSQDEIARSPDANLPISKRQRKRNAKHQKWLDLKPLRREKEREKLRVKKQKLKEERKRMGVDEDGIQGVKRSKMSDPEASEVTVVIDCSFDYLMNDSGVRKVAKQIQRCYAANRRSPSPFQLHLCSLNHKIKQRFDDVARGYVNWDLHMHEEPLQDVFPKEKIVYLSSESENVLQDLDPSKAYIIGGLVDHNHQKGLCHRLAVDEGWQHAQLPISDFIAISGRKVLTINQVFEILVEYVRRHDWKEAFCQVLPPRKVKATLPVIENGDLTNPNDSIDRLTTAEDRLDEMGRAEGTLNDQGTTLKATKRPSNDPETTPKTLSGRPPEDPGTNLDNAQLTFEDLCNHYANRADSASDEDVPYYNKDI